jgi:hypothetical protein
MKRGLGDWPTFVAAVENKFGAYDYRHCSAPLVFCYLLLNSPVPPLSPGLVPRTSSITTERSSLADVHPFSIENSATAGECHPPPSLHCFGALPFIPPCGVHAL